MTAVFEIRPGTTIGYLRVINQGESNDRGAARFWVECCAPGCHKKQLMLGYRLRASNKSCGCRRNVPDDPADIELPGE